MKGVMSTLVGTFMISAALALPAISFAAPPAPGEVHQQRMNNFPGMHEAISQLESTREYLKTDTAHDFNGHKTNAINDINAAIKELRLGIQSDRRHP